ncbi:MAG: dTDP-4-dehydrorhamnose 3,5-epimerase family protein [Promethearchaeota archaeon]
MKIISVKSLFIPDIKVIRFARFCDNRGYFTESFRKSDFINHAEINFLNNLEFVQSNESYSQANTIRGLHFQWNPYMGKLVRTLYGHMIDLFLDIRLNSPTFGKIYAYNMPSNQSNDFNEWIWVPPGFAHGNIFPENTLIEYFCTGEYSPGYEACISPLSLDIDWSSCKNNLRKIFDEIVSNNPIITEKDQNGLTIESWRKDERSKNFIYGKC